MHGLLLAIQRRARRFSLTAFLAYVSLFVVLSLGHTCELGPTSRDLTPAHAHRVASSRALHAVGHDCLACAWQRDTSSTPLLALHLPAPFPARGAVPRAEAPTTLAGAPDRPLSRGPPSA